jgi:hypothetical protein
VITWRSFRYTEQVPRLHKKEINTKFSSKNQKRTDHLVDLNITVWKRKNSYFRYSFIQVVCLTTGPKPLPKRALHIMRSRASSFKLQYPVLSLRSSSSFLRPLPRLPVTSIPPILLYICRLDWVEPETNGKLQPTTGSFTSPKERNFFTTYRP